MEQAKLIKELIVDNETFSAHLKRISKPGYTLHALDVDVMLEKLRKSYEQLLQLRAHAPKTAIDELQPVVPPVAIAKIAQVQQEKVEESQEKPAVELQQNEPPVQENITEPEAKSEEPETAAEARPVPPETEEMEPEQPSPELEIIAQKPPVEATVFEPTDQAAPEEPVTIAVKSRTTIDLFTQEPHETLGDKLNKQKDPSIAERMQHLPIYDLRSAIGINEKFLFINELFKGNLNHYNKTIDELNAFESINGAFTYLIETKVQNQWDDNSPVFKKLKELIERRFK